MKKSLFFRTVFLSSVIMLCLIGGFFGIAEAYENTRLVAFGEYRKAIQIEENGIYIFDYMLEF